MRFGLATGASLLFTTATPKWVRVQAHSGSGAEQELVLAPVQGLVLAPVQGLVPVELVVAGLRAPAEEQGQECSSAGQGPGSGSPAQAPVQATQFRGSWIPPWTSSALTKQQNSWCATCWRCWSRSRRH